MRDLERAMLAFHDELVKISAIPWRQMGHAAGALGGAGAAVGAGVGGLSGGYDAYQDARAHGVGVLGSALHGAGGAVSGAVTGGLSGGLVGGLGGAVGAKLSPDKTKHLADAVMNGPAGALGRFGQRQVHSATGWMPEGGLSSIRMGDHPEGMTNLPGIARNLRKDPVGTVQRGVQHQWKSSDMLGKAMIGLSGADLAYSALGPEDPNKGRAERIGGSVANAAGLALTGGLATIPSLAASMAATQVGSGVGRLIDQRKNRRPQGAYHPEYNEHLRDQETNGMTQPVERNMSPAAAGQTPEVG